MTNKIMSVMAGRGPANHVLWPRKQGVDARVKPGHDDNKKGVAP
jgi:hypothetical protein